MLTTFGGFLCIMLYEGMKFMRYQGGKTRLAKTITKYINADLHEKDYYEPFVGANNILPLLQLKGEAYCSDANKYVIAYHVQRKLIGWTPFKEFEGKDESKIKAAHKECRDLVRGKIETSKYTFGFCGYILNQCSFGSDFNGGFINREGKSYYKGVHDFFKYREKIIYKKNWNFETKNYLDVRPKNSVIYLDPPYEGTSKYQFGINHEEFWNYVREVAKDNIVYVSEQNAPPEFTPIWEKETTRTLNHFNNDKQNKKTAIEKLYRIVYND